MSGTSLDGIDIAYCEFTKKEQWEFKIIFAETFAYNDQWKNILSNVENSSAIDLARNNVFLGQLFGNITNAFIDFNKIEKSEIDAIASHGHTIFHQPELALTTQIGCGAQIAALTSIATVCDFRTTDVALGGQGAPLVPIGDRELFSEFNYCLNIGGIANVSFTENGNRISFDVGLANIVGNYLCQQLKLEYDDAGKIAASGSCDDSLLKELNAVNYFDSAPPKSLGKEFFKEEIKSILDKNKSSVEEKLHTFGVHLGYQIGRHLHNGKCIVTGGGAYNDFWVEQIKKHAKAEIVIPNKEIIDFKEALVFAFLGLLRLENEPNALSSVTGASSNSSGGCVYLG